MYKAMADPVAKQSRNTTSSLSLRVSVCLSVCLSLSRARAPATYRGKTKNWGREIISLCPVNVKEWMSFVKGKYSGFLVLLYIPYFLFTTSCPNNYPPPFVSLQSSKTTIWHTFTPLCILRNIVLFGPFQRDPPTFADRVRVIWHIIIVDYVLNRFHLPALSVVRPEFVILTDLSFFFFSVLNMQHTFFLSLSIYRIKNCLI